MYFTGYIAEEKLPEYRGSFRGLVVLFSEPVAPGAAKILREKGYRIEDFRSSQLTDEDLASADLVLAITKDSQRR